MFGLAKGLQLIERFFLNKTYLVQEYKGIYYFLVVCSKPLDVAFALDSSDDVSSFQWQRQKDFVSDVIDGLQIAPNGVHTGIVAYAAMPTVDLKLNVRSKDKQALLQNVAGLRRAVGQRNIASLLDMSKYQVHVYCTF